VATDRKDIEMLEALEREEQRRKRWTEWCPHKPHAKQMAFLALDGLEALYGGAAGGGKSDALLMAALQHVHVPGYAALILRRTFKDLMRSDAIMARAEQWLSGTRAVWKADTRTWVFPSGATLSFGYFDTARDREAYQGGAWQFVAFDETTQFPEAWYLYLFSRLRKTTQAVPLRMRSASNPGGIGHEWVFRRFITPGTPDAPFIPATLDDNPHIDAKSYRESLSKLDEVTRRQLLEGVWVRDSSGLVYRTVQRVAMAPQDGEWTYQLGVDFGIRDACAYVVLGWRKDDPVSYVLESMKESGKTVTESAERVKAYMERFDLSRIIGDLGGMGAAFGIEFQRRHGIPIEAAQKTGKLGYIGLMNGAIERGELVVVERDNEALLKEMGDLPWSDETKQKESPSFNNHLTDALLYNWRAAWSFLQTAPREPVVASPVEIIQAETAAIWRQHEEEMRRGRNAHYDIGDKFASDEDYS
jgi:hypothetical protein